MRDDLPEGFGQGESSTLREDTLWPRAQLSRIDQRTQRWQRRSRARAWEPDGPVEP